MHDIWNPWHGCRKISPGCAHCYIYYLDAKHGRDGSVVARSKTGFDYPLKKNRDRTWKVKPGERIRVCMTSDFFLEEADPWRDEAWKIMRKRPDVLFSLLTKRPGRIRRCLPDDWGSGYPNVAVGVTAENQQMANLRLPFLLDVPARYRHVNCAPLIGPVDLRPYLNRTQIHQVLASGENYDGCRPCDHVWAKSLRDQCRDADIQFCFYETGTRFHMAGREYWMPDKREQARMAYGLDLHYEPTEPVMPDIRMPDGTPAAPYEPYFGPQCRECGGRYICNGCGRCGKCE